MALLGMGFRHWQASSILETKHRIYRIYIYLVKHVLSPLTKCELSLSVSPGWSEDVGWPGDSAR